MEESFSCLKYSGNDGTVEVTIQGETDWCLELVDNVEKQVERVTSVGRQNGEKNEEKPNLKRRNNSLEESIVEGEGSLKKMKISAEPRDGEVQLNSLQDTLIC